MGAEKEAGHDAEISAAAAQCRQHLSEAGAVLRWYREFQANAPDEFYIFLGLQAVPAGDPFPKEHWNKKICVLLCLAQRIDGGWREGRERHPRRAAETDHRLGRADALSSAAIDVRRTVPEGSSVVLEGRFREDIAGRAIDAHLAQAAKLPSAVSCMHLYPIDGAVHRRKPDAIAWNCRDATWSLVIAGVGPIRRKPRL
jgi:hypothetical protein